MTENRKKITLYLNIEDHKRIKIESTLAEKSMNEFIYNAVKEKIEKIVKKREK